MGVSQASRRPVTSVMARQTTKPAAAEAAYGKKLFSFSVIAPPADSFPLQPADQPARRSCRIRLDALERDREQGDPLRPEHAVGIGRQAVGIVVMHRFADAAERRQFDDRGGGESPAPTLRLAVQG